MSEFTTQGPAPSVSNLNGRFRWDQGSGLQQFSSTAIAVTPSDPATEESDAENIQEVTDSIHDIGGGTVFLRNGTYLMDADVVIPSDVTFLGETQGAVILDFQSQAHQIIVQGANAYSEGTASVTNQSTTVTGVGSNWNSDMTARFISLQGGYYLIDSVTSATEIELGSPYEGTDLSDDTYVIADLESNVNLSTFTVQNSTHATGAVFLQYVQEGNIENLNVYDSTIGINIADCYSFTMEQFFIFGCDVGLEIENSNTWTLNDFAVYSSVTDNILVNRFYNCSISNFTNSLATENGITATNSGNWGLYDLSTPSTGTHGVELTDCNDIQINAVNISSSGGDGIKLVSGCVRISISSSSFISNTGYGINIAAASNEDNIVSGVSYLGNTAGTLNNSGTDTVIIPSAGGSGDVTGPASSVDSEIAIYSGTTGKIIKRATGTGIANLTSGVLSATATTGSGSVVLGTSPALTTPTGIVKGDVGLGNVDNTSDATKNSASVTLTNKTIDASQLVDGSTTSPKLAEAFFRGRYQSNTTDSAPTGLTCQFGWGYMIGNSTDDMGEAVTFPTAFASAPIVLVTFLSIKTTASGAPTGPDSFDVQISANAVDVSTLNISTSGFTVRFNHSGSTFSNAHNWGYSWLAIGAV